jgi:hypothetical protein
VQPSNPETSGPADPGAVKELWLECMRAADSHGNLEKQPTRRARTPRERAQARTQNYWLTRRVMGMPAGYDRIKWNHDTGGDAA